ncbi:hypothetical protein [Paraburkholderia xenovorans]|jgi:hypothetical protein
MMHMDRTTNVAIDESDAIRRELNAHNDAQRARYQARQQERTHLPALGVA